MKAVCISCFNYYENRVKHIENFLINKGFEVQYITSDFDHIKKEKYTARKTNEICIKTLPYYKNLSLRRLLSHYFFSKKAINEVNKIKPDLLYVIIPPNCLVKFAAKYKRQSNVKLIYDLYDLWPEAFPTTKVKRLLWLPFKIWANLRDHQLRYADQIFMECEFFQEKLTSSLVTTKTDILYLTKEDHKFEIVQELNCLKADTTNICYLGSINNVIDIMGIKRLLAAINKIKPVTLYIIGDGERRKELLRAMQDSQIKVEFQGKIFDAEKKRAIFSQCSFGLNMMRDTVCVGLTMKSIDYFQAGLPILNNIKADTAKFVEQYGIGFNVTEDNWEEVARKVAEVDFKQLLVMRKKTRQVFEALFSLAVFNEKLEIGLKGLIK